MRIRIVLLAVFSTLTSQLSPARAQGSLTPPGAPAPTMKSLAQIEPRTPISSLPYTITDSGSYYLTTNLTGSGGGTNGITITANHVTLDLAGFTLSGVPGSGTAITAPTLQTNLIIRNGIIRGWASGVFGNCVNGRFERLNVSDNGGGIQAGYGSLVEACTFYNCSYALQVSDACTVKGCICQNTGSGILAADDCTIESCTVMGNGFGGIAAGNSCTLKACTTKQNFPFGIKTGDACSLEGCTAFLNSSTGIVVGVGCAIHNCAARTNLTVGIHANDGCSIIDCASAQNGTSGIEAGSSCTIIGCSVYWNGGIGIRAEAASTITGCSVRANAKDGILVGSECRVADNSSSENALFGGMAAGVHATGSDNRIEGNLVTYNPNGIQAGTTNGNNTIIRNVAGVQFLGHTNYVIAPGNDVGPIGTAAAATSPWANISH